MKNKLFLRKTQIPKLCVKQLVKEYILNAKFNYENIFIQLALPCIFKVASKKEAETKCSKAENNKVVRILKRII